MYFEQHNMKSLILFASIILLSSCAAISERNIYEGIKSQQKMKDIGSSEKKQTLPSYEQYREEIK